MEMKRAGTLKVSKKTSAAFSRFLLGFRGASVRRTGCWKRKEGDRMKYKSCYSCPSRLLQPSLTQEGSCMQGPPSYLMRETTTSIPAGSKRSLSSTSLLPGSRQPSSFLTEKPAQSKRTPKPKEGLLPLLRMSAADLWNKRTARSSPCHSSPERYHVPWGTGWTTTPYAPIGQRVIHSQQWG